MVSRRIVSVFLLISFLVVPLVGAEETGLEISKGNIAGHRYARRFGDLETVSTAWQDVWIPGGDYVYPTVADFVNVSSTDADDTLLGTGVRILFIQGLDSNYDIISEEIEMDGTNNVTSTKEYIRVLRSETRESGSTQYNEGTISITQNEILLGVIEIEDGKTQMALFTVPNNYTAYLIDTYMTSSEDKVIEYEIAYKQQGWSWISFIEINTFRESFQHEFIAPVEFVEKTDLRIRVKAGSSSGEVGAGFVLLLIHDDYVNDITSMNATQAVREVGSVPITTDTSLTVSDPENQTLLYVGAIIIIAIALAALASGRKW